VPTGVPVYFLLGNHDHLSSRGEALFVEKLRQPLNQYVVIKGYPFITISQNGAGKNDYNAEAQQFLKTKMAEAAKDFPGKPIFVFFHVPPINTVYQSSDAEGGWGTGVFLPTLEQYPQAVVFSGHTHAPIGDPRSIHQDKFTSVNDGSTAYACLESYFFNGDYHQAENEFVTEGLIVNVSPTNNVEIERWDTYRNKEILPRWTLKAPHDGSAFQYKGRNGKPAPVFTQKSRASVSEVTDNRCRVTFPHAADNDAVLYYEVEILKNNQPVKTVRKFSEFYLYADQPQKMEVNITGLEPETVYRARVRAGDSWRNLSAPISTGEFRTKKLSQKPPRPFSVWDFDAPTNILKATAGNNLWFFGEGLAFVEGRTPTDGAVFIPEGTSLQAVHCIEPRLGDKRVNDYTVLFDFKVSELDRDYIVFRTDSAVGATPSTIRPTEKLIDKHGSVGYSSLGKLGDPSVVAGRWHRAIATFLENEWFNIYIDGRLVYSARRYFYRDGFLGLLPAFCIEGPISISRLAIFDTAVDERQAEMLNDQF
jgi:hypothetical protein